MTKSTTLDDLIRQAIRTLPDGYEIHLKAERGAHWCIGVSPGGFPIFIGARGTPPEQARKCLDHIAHHAEHSDLNTATSCGVATDIIAAVEHLPVAAQRHILQAIQETVCAADEEN